MTTRTPASNVDLFSDDAVTNPLPRYRELRDSGGAVWLERYGVWALSGYADVRAALRADDVLISSKGVALQGPGRRFAGASRGYEALRFGSPVRAFTRYVSADYKVDDSIIPAGDRVLILYACGCANGSGTC